MPTYMLGKAAPSGWRPLYREDHRGGGVDVYAATYEHEDRPAGWFLGSCAVGALRNLTKGGFDSWQDKAEFLAALYRALYSHGNVVYCIASYQNQNAVHLALMEIGARQIDEFPNLYHGPHMARMYRVCIRNVAGRFCNKYGEAYKNESEVNPEDIIPERTKAVAYHTDSPEAKLPKRN